jgi:MFS family permease
VIRLAARLAVSGGRESVVRLVLTAVGVALGTTLLLLLVAADPAIRAHQRAEAWQHTGRDASEQEGAGDPLLWSLTTDSVDGREMVVLLVAAGGPEAPVPVGLPHVPEPGELYVSPALGELVEQLPAGRLADRYPSAPAGTIGDDFLVGPDELVAVVGAAPEDLGDPNAPGGPLEVHQVRTAPAPLQFSDLLRLVLGVGAVGLLVPVVVFVSTSTRLGAARREQRFAALRLAGATPRQTNLMAAVEAGAAATLGAGVGFVGYLLSRPIAAGIEIDGEPSFVADVRVPIVLLVLILLAVPLVAVASALASLRRLQISPLGVARRSERSSPTARRLVPLVVGSFGFAVSLWFAIGSNEARSIVPVMAAFAVMIGGIVAAGPWLTVLVARFLRRSGRRAGTLLAGRRLEDDPATGFRAVSGLVLAVFVASTFAGITPALLAEAPSGGDGMVQPSTLVVELLPGTERAAAAAARVAALDAGADGGLVLHEDPDPSRLLADPAVGRGPTFLVACADLSVAAGVEHCPADGTAWVGVSQERLDLESSTIAASELDAVPPALLLLETDGSPATSDRVRTAVQQEVPGARTWLGAEAEEQSNRRLTQLQHLVEVALAIVLVIAGCSLAVAVAGGIIERARPFALLRLSGVRIGELRQVAMLEAAAPLLLMAGASAVLGLATSAVIVGMAGGIVWAPPAWGYWASLLGGLAVALAVAAATLPLLDRATAPDAVRFE